ncbi:unnamed protein product [Rotaria sp. Silwood2]|nr:unnamed protein product [Rotaria sp. Silwood2]
MKIFQIERDLLLQTCDTIDRIKFYLSDRLLEMKDSYCIYLSTGEVLFYKIKMIYFIFIFFDNCKSSDRLSSSLSSSSSNGTNNQYQQQLKAKYDRIKQLEKEKRVLLKELVEMRHQHRTVISAKNL